MNHCRMSSSFSLVKFWRYIFLSLLFLMVVILYMVAPQGNFQPHFNKNFRASLPDYKIINSVENKTSLDPYKINKKGKPAPDIAAPTCDELCQKFAERGYTLAKDIETDDYTVARVYLASLPKDFSRLDYSAKKKLFLKSLLPLILETNEKIAAERQQLLQIMSLKRAGIKLSRSHHKWLSELAIKYRLKKMCMNELCQRVDVIPASLALSQAITETGWGTSYAAKEKKSPFGFTVSNRVISFKTLRHSVEAYIQTLNSHPAYQPLRKIRSLMRKKEAALCGLELAKGLKNYSTRGQAYIYEIQQVIKHNNLKQFDSAKLVSSL